MALGRQVLETAAQVGNPTAQEWARIPRVGQTLEGFFRSQLFALPYSRARAALDLPGFALRSGDQEPRLLPARREAPGDEAPVVHAGEVHHRRDLAEGEIVAEGGVGLAQERAAEGELAPAERAAGGGHGSRVRRRSRRPAAHAP